MSGFALALRALEFLLLVIGSWFREQTKEEGRQEVRTEQVKANEAAAEVAAEIDDDTAAANLDVLRGRMRHYQRPPDAL